MPNGTSRTKRTRTGPRLASPCVLPTLHLEATVVRKGLESAIPDRRRRPRVRPTRSRRPHRRSGSARRSFDAPSVRSKSVGQKPPRCGVLEGGSQFVGGPLRRSRRVPGGFDRPAEQARIRISSISRGQLSIAISRLSRRRFRCAASGNEAANSPSVAGSSHASEQSQPGGSAERPEDQGHRGELCGSDILEPGLGQPVVESGREACKGVR